MCSGSSTCMHLQRGVFLIHQLKMDWDLSASFLVLAWLGWICLCPSGLLQESYGTKQEEASFETSKSHVWCFHFLLHSPTCQASLCDPWISLSYRSDPGCRDRPVAATDSLQHHHETSPCLDDAKPEPAESGPGAGAHGAAASRG